MAMTGLSGLYYVPQPMAHEEFVAQAGRELGDAVAFAVAVGCPVHGTKLMDYDADGAFCHGCEG